MTEFTAHDTEFMTQALRLAARGATTARPNPIVGCVLVDEQRQVVGEGWHERTGEAHAEVHALAEAGAKANGATAYVTLEPCSHQGRTPPCADQLVAAGVARVIFAVEDPNPEVAGKGGARLRSAGISVASGLLQQQAIDLNQGFFSRMQRGRPWLRLKLATSLDGRTALNNGVSQWITGAQARADVHRWRALSGVVMTGIDTVVRDDPSLTARDDEQPVPEQPGRVVLDSALRTPTNARLLKQGGPVTVFHSRGDAGAEAALKSAGAAPVRGPGAKNGVDLPAVLGHLAGTGINDVWVEAGATLSGVLLEQGYVDELMVYQAATVLGSDARGMFDIAMLSDMDKQLKFTLKDCRAFGDDMRMIYRPAV